MVKPQFSKQNLDPTLAAMMGGVDAPSYDDGYYRFDLAGAEGISNGSISGRTICPGFSIVAYDFEPAADRHVEVEQSDHIKINCRLGGTSEYECGGQKTVSREGDLSILIPSPGDTKRERYQLGVRQRSVTLVCDRNYLSNFVSPSRAVRNSFDCFLSGRSVFAHFHELLSPTIRSLALQCYGGWSNGVDALLMDARATELLYMSLTALTVADHANGGSVKGIDKVHELIEILKSPSSNGMSIPQFARRLAWNETQMMESFRLVTGCTISAFRTKTRMAQAFSDLQSTSRPIGEIAYDAGYEHPANFSTAFRKEFGMSPLAVRKSAGWSVTH